MNSSFKKICPCLAKGRFVINTAELLALGISLSLSQNLDEDSFGTECPSALLLRFAIKAERLWETTDDVLKLSRALCCSKMDSFFKKPHIIIISSFFSIDRSTINMISKWILSYVVKVSSSYHLSVECFSQLSFDSEVYTKSAAVSDFVYSSESNESCEKHSTQRW